MIAQIVQVITERNDPNSLTTPGLIAILAILTCLALVLMFLTRKSL